MKFNTLTGFAALVASAALLTACASSKNGQMGVMGNEECCGSDAKACCQDKGEGNMGVVGSEKSCSEKKDCSTKSECTDKKDAGNMGVIGDDKKSDCSGGGAVCPFSGKQG